MQLHPDNIKSRGKAAEFLFVMCVALPGISFLGGLVVGLVADHVQGTKILYKGFSAMLGLGMFVYIIVHYWRGLWAALRVVLFGPK